MYERPLSLSILAPVDGARPLPFRAKRSSDRMTVKKGRSKKRTIMKEEK